MTPAGMNRRAEICDRLHDRSTELAERWLERIAKHRSLEPPRVFPRQGLLDHIPELLERIFASISRERTLEEDSRATAKLRNLADLRRLQGFAVSEVVGEFELLGEIVFDALTEEVTRQVEPRDGLAIFEISRQMSSAFLALSRVTSERFLQSDREDRIGRANLLGEYARTLGHELKSHTDTAHLWLTLAQEALDSGDVAASRSRLENTKRTIRRISEIARDTYAVTISHGRPVALQGQRQGLREALRELLEDLRLHAADAGVDLRGPTEIPDFAVDSGRLQLVLVNLVSNAVKFAHPERERRTIELRVVPEASRVWRLEVADNCIGVPDEARGRIFESAYRAERDMEVEGSGLGLAVARAAAEQMGGRLYLERSTPDGTTFVLEIREPLERLEEDPIGSD